MEGSGTKSFKCSKKFLRTPDSEIIYELNQVLRVVGSFTNTIPGAQRGPKRRIVGSTAEVLFFRARSGEGDSKVTRR